MSRYDERLIRAAGILEGEGSFFTQTGKHSPQISCEMADQDVVEELHSLFGGSIRHNQPRKAHYKETWTWCVQGDAAETVMTFIRPHMFSRRQGQIQVALAIWQARKVEIQRQLDNSKAAAIAYENGEGSLRQVSKRYGISYQTVKNHLTGK